MFGVVPRTLWSKVAPPDSENRVRLNMNCVFIDTGAEKILIDTGIGEKFTEKQQAIYAIDRKRSFGESLKAIAGVDTDEITIVINTHLHFDHAGGNTILSSPPYEGGVDPDVFLSGDAMVLSHLSPTANRQPPTEQEVVLSSAVPQFPNARYMVSKSEFAHAETPHERDRASYLPENWRPIQETGQLELMPETYEVVNGLTMQQVRGHSETMQTWRLSRGEDTVYGFADLIPMRHHLPVAWVAGFDLYPTETLAFKKEILPLALRENWYCLFYHDIDSPLSRLKDVDGKIVAEPVK